MEYGGSLALDPPAPEDENNVIVALNQSHRVTSINLAVTNPLMEKLSDIEGPFLELEDFILLCRDTSRLTLPSAFGCGTRRLRTLHLTRIAFFALPHLLYSSRNIIDLQLHDVFNPWLLVPEALTDALSRMTQLRSLSLHFLPTTDHFSVSLPVSIPSRKRIVLPSLARLDFQGTVKYLEGLLANIDTPWLGVIEGTFIVDSITDLSIHNNFIDRTETHRLSLEVHLQSSENTITLSFIQAGTTTCIKLQLFCEQFSDQLSSMSQILTHFPTFLVDAEDLHISLTRQSIPGDSLDWNSWLEFVKSFTGIRRFHVAGNLSTDIVRAFQSPGNQPETLVPVLQKLYLHQPGPSFAHLRETVVSFMVLRRLSGYPIEVEYEQLYQISELRGTGTIIAQLHHHHSLTGFE